MPTKNYARYWEKKGDITASGVWATRNHLYPLDGTRDHHAHVRISVFSKKYYEELLIFTKKCHSFQQILSCVDAFTEQYSNIGEANNFILFGLMTLSSHVLRNWLPDMPWATLFGPCYVEHFGLEKLLSVPAHNVENLGNAVFIQLTSKIDDLWEKFPYVMDCREQAKHHLGYDSFWQSSLHYDWREEPDKAGKVFRVPKLPFLDDCN